MFIDDDANSITLQPHEKRLSGSIAIYYELILGTPADYAEYKLSFAHDMDVCMKNIEYILQLTNATKLSITENSGAAFEMQKRPNRLKNLAKLEVIDLSIAEAVYMRLRIQPFIDALGSLKTAIFTAYSISAEQFDVFVKSQTIPSGWKCVQAKAQYHCTKEGGQFAWHIHWLHCDEGIITEFWSFWLNENCTFCWVTGNLRNKMCVNDTHQAIIEFFFCFLLLVLTSIELPIGIWCIHTLLNRMTSNKIPFYQFSLLPP